MAAVLTAFGAQLAAGEVSKETTWQKPEGFVPQERKWEEHTSQDGKKFYFDAVREVTIL